MSATLRDAVIQETTTQGAGAYILGEVVAGGRSFAAAFSDGGATLAGSSTGTVIVQYVARSKVEDGQFEAGYADLAVATGVLTPTRIASSSNNNAKVNWGPGTRVVFCAPAAAALVTREADGTIPGTVPPSHVGSRGADQHSIVTADSAGFAAPSQILAGHGAVVLTCSGGALHLTPRGGGGLWIAGGMRSIPTGGVDLSPTGLTPLTSNNIYAGWSGSAVTLKASIAPPVVGTGGVVFESGTGETWTFVGLAYVAAGPAFADSQTQRYVASYFNRPRRVARAILPTAMLTGATGWNEMSGSLRLGFVCFSGESVSLRLQGTVQSGPGQTGWVAGYVDVAFDYSGTGGGYGIPQIASSASRGAYSAFHIAAETTDLAAGYHGATALIQTSGGVVEYMQGTSLFAQIG